MNCKLRRISLSLCGFAAVLTLSGGRTAAQADGRATVGYVLTDLGTLGGANSFAYSINGSGMVPGGANTPGQNDQVAQKGFLWPGGGPLIPLDTLGGSLCPDCSSMGVGVSASGIVAMLSETADFDPNDEDFCEFGTHRQCLAAVWRDYVLTPLPTLVGGTSGNAEAFFMNSRGEIVGTSETSTPDDTCIQPFQVRRYEAVKWSPAGVPTPLPPPAEDTVSFGFTSNDRGQVVGFSGLCSNVMLPSFLPPSAPHAVMWDPSGTPHNLGQPEGGAGNNVAVGINNRGEITVNSVMNDGTIRAFVWNAGSFQQLATPTSDAVATVASCCNNINDRGQIVGFSVDSNFNQTVLLWDNARAAPVDVNTLLPQGTPWYLFIPAGITNDGEIAAGAFNVNTGEVHAVVLSPRVPGNGTSPH